MKSKRKPCYAAKGLPKVPGKPRGTDIIPAWLTPGEAVLSPGAAEMLGRGNVQALNRAANHMQLGSPQYRAEGDEDMQQPMRPDLAMLGNQRADEILSNPDMFNAKEFRAAERYMDPAGLAGGPSPQRDAALLVGTRSLDSINSPIEDATRQQFSMAQSGLFGTNQQPQRMASEDLTSEGLGAAQSAVSGAVSYGLQAAQEANDRARYMSKGGFVPGTQPGYFADGTEMVPKPAQRIPQQPQYFMGGATRVGQPPRYLAGGGMAGGQEKRKLYPDMPTVTQNQPQSPPAGYQAGQQLMGGQADRLGKITAPLETGMNSLAEVYKQTGGALAAGTQRLANTIDQAQNFGVNFVRGGLGMKPNQPAPSLISSATADTGSAPGTAMKPPDLMQPNKMGVETGMNPTKPAAQPLAQRGTRFFTDQASADAAAKKAYYEEGMVNEGNRSYLTPSQAQTDFVNSGRKMSETPKEELYKIYPGLRDAAAKDAFDASQRSAYQKKGLAVPWSLQTPDQRLQTQAGEDARAQRQAQNASVIGNQMAGLNMSAQRLAQGYMSNALTILNNPAGYTDSQVRAAEAMLTRLTPLAQTGVANSNSFYETDANRPLRSAQANQANSAARLNNSSASLNEMQARQPVGMQPGGRANNPGTRAAEKMYSLELGGDAQGDDRLVVNPNTGSSMLWDRATRKFIPVPMQQALPQQTLGEFRTYYQKKYKDNPNMLDEGLIQQAYRNLYPNAEIQ